MASDETMDDAQRASDEAREPLLKRVGASVEGTSLMNHRLMKNPKFRALLVESDATTTTNEQLMALTTFSFMAKQTEGLAGPELSTLNDCGEAGCGFTKFYQFKGVVGVYAGFWAYTVILIAMYVIRKAPPPGTEFASYALFTAAMATFVVMSITECASVVLSSDYYVCKNADYSLVSLIFAAATIVLNCLTCAFAWRQWGELKFVGLPKTLSALTETYPG